jgi:putative cardiolipin synthase
MKISQVCFYLVTLSFVILSGCATLPENVDRQYSSALQDTDDTTIGRVVKQRGADYPGKSGFFLLGNGLDAFVARVVLANAAERSIDVQYYLYHNDLVGNLLSYSLLRAADRGARVRILLDDMGLEGRGMSIATFDSHPNVEIRIFNPFSRNVFRGIQFLTRFGSVTRRMHNKSFTIDNQITIVGGRNIGNEYFDADPDLAFGDLDVMALGPVVQEVSTSFDKYWNSELAYPISTLKSKVSVDKLDKVRPELDKFVDEQKDSAYYSALDNSDLARKLRAKDIEYSWGSAKALYDDPEKILHDTQSRELHLAPQLAPYFDQLKDEIIIFSAYFVPGREGVRFLKDLRKRGIRVRIVTNSMASTDVTLVHGGYSKYRREMLRAGIELYEMNKKLTREQRKEKKGAGGSSKASLHAKAYIFDREELFIGSLNLDPRSFDQNTEIGIVFHSPELGAMMGEGFDRDIDSKTFRVELHKDKDDGLEFLRWVTIENGETRTYNTDPYTSFWRRFLVGLSSLLPIESQL